MRRRVDQRSVEAGGLRVKGQHQLVLTEQRLRVRLRVGFPLRQRDDPPSAQRVPPARTENTEEEGGGADLSLSENKLLRFSHRPRHSLLL